MAHSSFLLRDDSSQAVLCLPELFCTVIERPKELTNTALASGILGKLNKSRRHLYYKYFEGSRHSGRKAQV